LTILPKFESPVTTADVAKIEGLIEDVSRHNEEMEKWIKEG